MSLKTKILAAGATITLLGGLGTAAALTAASAGAATPSCGATCVNTFPAEYAGTSNNAPQFVIDVLRQSEKVGQPVILFRAANYDPAEDWTFTNRGPASNFYAAGLLSSSLALTYGCSPFPIGIPGASIPCSGAAVDDQAFEIQYAPFGVDSGLCLGVASAAFAGEGVTLQACGVSSRTTWLQDTLSNDGSPATPPPGRNPTYWAAINGSGSSFSNPLVLTYPGNAYPTDKPRQQLLLETLQQFSNGVTPTPSPTTGSNVTDDSNQLWTAFEGVLP